MSVKNFAGFPELVRVKNHRKKVSLLASLPCAIVLQKIFISKSCAMIIKRQLSPFCNPIFVSLNHLRKLSTSNSTHLFGSDLKALLTTHLKFTAYWYQRSKKHHESQRRLAKVSENVIRSGRKLRSVVSFAWFSALSMTGNPSKRDMNETSSKEELQSGVIFNTIRQNTGQNIMKSVILPFFAVLYSVFVAEFQNTPRFRRFYCCSFLDSAVLSPARAPLACPCFLTALYDKQNKAICKIQGLPFEEYMSSS